MTTQHEIDGIPHLPLKDRERLIHWKDAIIHLGLLDTHEGADLTPAIELTSYLKRGHRGAPAGPRRRHPVAGARGR
jgi:hypothetical protein